MAKSSKKTKRTSGGAVPNDLRWGDKSLRDIEDQLKVLEKQLGILRGIKESMVEAELNTVRVDGVTKFERGVDILGSYTDNLSKAVSRETRKQELGGRNNDTP